MPKPSALSKKLDQLYIAKAELNATSRLVMKRNLNRLDSTFRSDMIYLLGLKGWKRLKKTADRAKMTPAVYARLKLVD